MTKRSSTARSLEWQKQSEEEMAACYRSTECVCVALRATWREIFRGKCRSARETNKGGEEKEWREHIPGELLIRHPPPVKAH